MGQIPICWWIRNSAQAVRRDADILWMIPESRVRTRFCRLDKSVWQQGGARLWELIATGCTVGARTGRPIWQRRAKLLVLLVSLLSCAWAAAWNADRLLEAAARVGGAAPQGAKLLTELVASAGAADEESRLMMINQFFNRRIIFRDDNLVWGQLDYWASPLETLAKGMGDCEDYAIAKYFGLIAAGVAPVKLRLIYVRATIGGAGGPQQAHMVLAYYSQPASEPLVLDNLITDIRPASRRLDLTPVFSFNADGLWQGSGTSSTGDPSVRLSKWREVLVKAREQGFD